ncbi:MAG: DUF3536 domain-containing protein [Bacteroidota bacterium]
MKNFVCVHGHFYQPPRENPWLEKIEQQDSAYPFHDWNERITYECYEANTASRILDEEDKILRIVNNYSRISFNVGPTLLLWLEKNSPSTYSAILEADRLSREKYSGHGSAMAQAYNHMIMPLANERDKKTQVYWGIKDFEHRFGRKPEGMWLPETAADTPTLEVLAEQGIKFTLLAPGQAKRYRKIGDKDWVNLEEQGIDTKKPYRCNLPSGKSIVLFFYDGGISNAIAFQGLLKNGKEFADRLTEAFIGKDEANQLVHVATDGESYGHHHRYGDMALAFCLNYIEKNEKAHITIYGEYLEKNPPEFEAEIHEATSWSCAHGVERWKSDCGCKTTGDPKITQGWRAPLREALDWLRDELIKIHDEEGKKLLKDPWKTRDDYIEVILDREPEHVKRFVEKHAIKDLSREERVKIRKLLEMQRHAMLMYTSCGWFFDDISGIETVQILLYAARAIQLARDVAGAQLENNFKEILKKAVSNYPKQKNGAHIYNHYVASSIIDLIRVGAHYAISSLFMEYSKNTLINEYQVFSKVQHKLRAGSHELNVGKVLIRSSITEEEKELSYAVVYLGNHNMIGAVREFQESENFSSMYDEIRSTFQKRDITQMIGQLDKHFDMHNYSFWHLFKDEQREILNRILQSKLDGITGTYRQIFNNNYGLLIAMREIENPIPLALKVPGAYILNHDLKKELSNEKIDIKEVKRISNEIEEFEFELDPAIGFLINLRLNQMMEHLYKSPEDIVIIQKTNTLFGILHDLEIEIDLWKMQNFYYLIYKSHYEGMQKKADEGENGATVWINQFNNLSKNLNVKVK